ncbi:MAG TPA: IclR family transcriptional regulator C-terminal domain-containing protein [Ilumatobacteraceae bacterium]|nr:IclR family transcriptional regulator C-terminal domain-containing protein [Ilumatobacteraceae bacterium]
MPQASPASQPRATDRGLALLRVVADHATNESGGAGTHGIALADAARAVDLSPSTALRQLRSLETAGFAGRNAQGRYLPGPELLRIARNLAATATLPRLAEAALLALAVETGESAYLAEVVDSRHAVYIASQPGSHAVRHVSWLGQRVTRRSSAVGAALAGKVDADGVAVRLDAVEPGITAVSAPVHDGTGKVVAAVSVVGPSFRLTDTALATARAAVARCASTIQQALGPR